MTRAHDRAQALAQALRAHIRAISERYILPGETAEGALMFLPSEAVYAELHANLPDVVREGFAARVWIVSPTTLMATLTTLRAALKDTRLRDEAQAVRREIALMASDAERLGARVTKLERIFSRCRAIWAIFAFPPTRSPGAARGWTVSISHRMA